MKDYYTMQEKEEYLNLFEPDKIVIRRKKGIEYYNIPCSFDIETTSAYYDENNNVYQAKEIALLKERTGKDYKDKYSKVAFMYIWQLDIDDKIIIGRTWNEYKEIIKDIIDLFDLSDEKKMIIYVHNLAFEFQFLKNVFKFDKVFATEERKIIYGETFGFTYKCSLFLSNEKLEKVGEHLLKYKVQKMVGDLDYNLIRTSKTPLSDKEIKYCINDVKVVVSYIREQMEKERWNSILNIPLTKTGYVRRYCKRYCLKGNTGFSYKKIMDKFSYDEKSYNQLKRLYAGAHTHASALNVNIKFKNVHSCDFTSSYPFVLISEKYPMSKGYDYKVKSISDFVYNLKKYCCVFDIKFKNIRLRENVCDSVISKSKCASVTNCEEDNGKVVTADSLVITLNEVDFSYIRRFYDWDSFEIANFKRYKKDYLPKSFIECIIHFYQGKTELKDVVGKEEEYQLLKSMLNSIYGMCVTDIIRENHTLDELNLWISEMDNVEESLEKYSNSRNRFIAYEWGVWCTSYAKRNLLTGIYELGEDFIYSDTDSVKFLNYETHKEYFNAYNKRVEDKLKEMCNHYNIDFNELKPKTKDGEEKLIGVWDYEGKYEEFKALGSKRYCYTKVNKKTGEIEFKITISGVNKDSGAPYLVKRAKEENCDVFDLFTDDLYFDLENTGKLIHTYIDGKIELKNVKDYLGNVCDVCEKSSVHLEPTGYSLSLVEKYVNYFNHVQEKARRGL